VFDKLTINLDTTEPSNNSITSSDTESIDGACTEFGFGKIVSAIVGIGFFSLNV